tara:strand:- start:92 stop:1219 length:1128 start_codon:yes stop_codon:yes gene_type:complete
MEQAGYWIKQGNWPTAGNVAYNLYSWGLNTSGQLGQGNTTTLSSPKQVGTLAAWLNIACGYNHTLATKTDGTLWAWGSGATYGQLGLGNKTNYSSPKQVGALTTWSNISCGSSSSLATKTDGTLWSWGQNNNGQLGLGNITYYSSPKQVGGLTTWSTVASSDLYTLAIKTDGTLWSWGANASGQLGLGNITYFSSPKQVGLLTNWSGIAIDNLFGTSLATKTDGTLWSWGYNTFGGLGQGNTTVLSSPKQVGALTTWSKITVCNNCVLATKTDGTLWAWGGNGQGQLGLNNTTMYSSPKQVGALTTWSNINMIGNVASMAIKTNGTLWSWGDNSSGQLGLGNTTYRSSPNQVGALTTWLKTSKSGGKFVMAILGS